MTAITPMKFHALLRSLPDRERPARERRRDHRPHGSPWSPARRVVGHIAATTFIFISFVTLVWLASWGFSFLHSIHAFSDEAYQIFRTLEVVLVFIDATLSGVVLLCGLWQYILSTMRGDS